LEGISNWVDGKEKIVCVCVCRVWMEEKNTQRESKGEEKSSVGNVEGIRKRKKRRGEEEDGRKKRLFGAVRS
jgi:hypothetical protein